MKSEPVGIGYKVAWPLRYLLAPTHFEYVEKNSIPKKFVHSDVSGDSSLTLCFLGDLMGIGRKTVQIGDKLLQLFQGSNKVIVNLESVLSKERGIILASQYTYPTVFKKLAQDIGTDKLMVGLANNHLFDFGDEGVESTLSVLNEMNTQYFGLKQCPHIELAPGLSLIGSTMWKAAGDRFANDDPHTVTQGASIQFIHWGSEFKKYPSASQKKFAESCGSFMTVGHHSHSPQELHGDATGLRAYSLGNFLTISNTARINSGLVLKVELVESNGWRLKQTEWDYIDIKPTKDFVSVEVAS